MDMDTALYSAVPNLVPGERLVAAILQQTGWGGILRALHPRDGLLPRLPCTSALLVVLSHRADAANDCL
jgi:hypothetical protein